MRWVGNEPRRRCPPVARNECQGSSGNGWLLLRACAVMCDWCGCTSNNEPASTVRKSMRPETSRLRRRDKNICARSLFYCTHWCSLKHDGLHGEGMPAADARFPGAAGVVVLVNVMSGSCRYNRLCSGLCCIPDIIRTYFIKRKEVFFLHIRKISVRWFLKCDTSDTCIEGVTASCLKFAGRLVPMNLVCHVYVVA
jgi:hypothetical protein